MLFKQCLLSKLSGLHLYPFGRQPRFFGGKLCTTFCGNSGGLVIGKCHTSYLQSVCSWFSFLKLLFLLQNKSYKKSRSHCALCMRLYARKIPLIVLLFVRPAKKQDKSIKLVFFEISIFISKQRFLLFLKLFFVFLRIHNTQKLSVGYVKAIYDLIVHLSGNNNTKRGKKLSIREYRVQTITFFQIFFFL